ncbi:hypothetical protein M2138_000364 [Dysgonomonadaceae bacterium PH5-43]|nr:hypothetical protein [Dysgonomonadaceae bacterium PH5-43]
MRYVLLFLLSLIVCNIQAQFVNDIYENEESESDVDNLIEELSYISENPYNLHTVTKEQLERLPFLSDLQIENILYYIYKYAPLVSIYELKNVEGLDMQTIFYLIPYVYVGDTNEEKKYIDNLKYSKQTFILRTNRSLQKSEDDYLGNPYYLNFRYNLNVQDKIQFGITGEKDAGETFSKHYPYGFDYYTYNLVVKDLGFVNELHVGNYRLSFGEGLLLNNNFSVGKSNSINNIALSGKGIKRHLSNNESEYFSGIATKLTYKDIHIYLFYSNKEQDANTNDSVIYSFKTDGLHRTYNDLLKKNAAEIKTIGKHISFNKDNLRLGVTAVYYSFGGKKLNPELKPHNVYSLRGDKHYNIGVNYFYRYKRISLVGETAIDKSGGIATLNNLHLEPTSFLKWFISFRHYDKRYNALFGKTISESSLQGETGLLTGFKLPLFKTWEIMGYFDYFSFPYLRYNVNVPSTGNEVSLSLKRFSKKSQLSFDYRNKSKYKDITPYYSNKLRGQFDYVLSKNFNCKSQLHYNKYTQNNKQSDAWSVTQAIAYTNNKSTVKVDVGIAYFKAKDWDTRICIYEKNVLYAAGFHNYYGEGLRCFAVAKWQVFSPLTVYFKFANSYFVDKADKTDMYLLVKYNF